MKAMHQNCLTATDTSCSGQMLGMITVISAKNQDQITRIWLQKWKIKITSVVSGGVSVGLKNRESVGETVVSVGDFKAKG